MNDETTDKLETYMLNESGKLFRKGQHIGTLEGEEMKLLPDFKNYTASVTRWLRDQANKQEPAPISLVKDDLESPSTDPLTEQQRQESRVAAAQREVLKAKTAAKTQWDEDCAFATRTGCPPPPKKNPQFGDKSPAFVEWLHEYRHDEFCKRFGVIKRGKVPVVETNPATDFEEVTGYRDTYFATRKTHLTEIDTASRTLGDDMSWDA